MKKIIYFLLIAAALAGIYRLFIYQTPEEKTFARTLADAKQGNVSAQLQAGDLYAAGTGTKQDGAQAVNWYRQAALAGEPEALWKCAQAYSEGKLVEKD